MLQNGVIHALLGSPRPSYPPIGRGAITPRLLLSLPLLAASAAAQPLATPKTPSARTAALLPGLGSPSRPAQQFFERGLAIRYGFKHDEAARPFAPAAALDPASPMPHWGIA
ncbi:MAG: hypothetical protein ACK58M_27120 [Acidobacteriota bacterium]|nr:hypothetical protein [Bryobacteraceae bacterium CoA2 C42]MCA2965566.1 hypothetical protein [Acidobacteriaceae bacterium]